LVVCAPTRRRGRVLVGGSGAHCRRGCAPHRRASLPWPLPCPSCPAPGLRHRRIR